MSASENSQRAANTTKTPEAGFGQRNSSRNGSLLGLFFHAMLLLGVLNMIPKVSENSLRGLSEFLYLYKKAENSRKPRLKATFRRFLCPDYPAATRISRRFCGIHYVSQFF